MDCARLQDVSFHIFPFVQDYVDHLCSLESESASGELAFDWNAWEVAVST